MKDLFLFLAIMIVSSIAFGQGNNKTVKDIDGNVYNTVTIGTQTWMAENLKTTKFNDGTSIPIVIIDNEWVNLKTPGYCWYKNEAMNKNIYGALYNWFTVNTGKLCPKGWHIPSNLEWKGLCDFCGGDGDKLKESNTTHWNSPNTGATNESGFTALPGGGHFYGGIFLQIGTDGYWWSSSEISSDAAWHWCLNHTNYGMVQLPGYKQNGLSIRCLKD